MKRLFRWLTATTGRRVLCALLALCAMVYIPLAGNYGMWDPWETHYGEVARQMLERNDFVSQWWPGSPQDRAEFWSKPVLTFWLMAMGMKAFGLEWGANPPPGELTDSWRVEWASRLPFIALSLLAIWAVYELVRRLSSTRAAAFSAVILATSAQWVFITRQAMTDMAFVAPMTVALAFAALGLLLPEEERERELPRGELRLGPLTFVWPRTRAYYAFAALFTLTTLPQLLVISAQLHLAFRLGSTSVRLAGVVPMLPYFAAFLGGLWWCSRARTPRQLYLFSGYVLCALASLAKGPAGVVLPAIVLVLYLILAGRWRDIIFKLEIPRGLVLFIATGFPWYHAMLIRHGMGFWNEFIGDNYVHRAGGRHGDRGTFEYYLQWLGYGMFPWSGIVTLGGLLSFKRLRDEDPRKGLIGFALVWFLVEFTTMSLVNTKFHHYILPALPAAAILGGLFLDDVLRAPSRLQATGLLLLAAPITFFCGRDLSAFPPRLLWLFNYDYVNMPGTGRPWPLPSLYGDRYEYGTQLLVFALAATLAVVALGVAALVALKGRGADAPEPPSDLDDGRDTGPYRESAGPARETPASEGAQPVPFGTLALVAGGFVVALVAGIALGPGTPNGVAPQVARLAWLAPTLLMVPFVLLLARVVARARAPRGEGTEERSRLYAAWGLALVGVVFSSFLADKLLIELSPHWSQKHVIAAYFQKRKDASEPLIAWQLYWRGENFYTRNSIYKGPDPNEKTVFLGDHNAEKLQTYFKTHAGRRVFFVVERTRFESLRQLLPAASRSSLTVVDDSNNKVYLASANI